MAIQKKSTPQGKKKDLKGAPKDGKALLIWMLVALGILSVFHIGTQGLEKQTVSVSYGEFYDMLEGNESSGQVQSAILSDTIVRGQLQNGSGFIVHIPEGDQEIIKMMRENIHNFDVKPPKTLWMNIFYSLGPMILFIVFLWFFIYRGASGGGGGAGRIWSFGKSKPTVLTEGHTKVTFQDVAGVDEAKEELQEVIEFLKDPKRFQRLGGKIPKGVLLLGPPGCGKTLLAKAVSGEANVPFLSISGSDFVEMFVGVGASRVRDLFEQAKRSAKQSGRGAIIFIDEIDAVGRQRFAGIGGGHDEREQTLNALLVEMDGFNTQEGVILIAATNRPDVLDAALLRPGRFDRQIVVSRPDIVGREDIIKVHMRNVKMDKTVDLKSLARQTPGFSGADLANLVNEAALLAARKNKESVSTKELEESIERVIAGPEKKSKVISKKEKLLAAYHESGHAILALVIPGSDPLHKVSILPRGLAGGYTMLLPIEDKHYYMKSDLMVKITGYLGGRASEELTFNEVSNGAQDDLNQATKIARDMVMRLGMSEKLGHLTFGHREEQVFLGRDLMDEKSYSDQTALIIDQEVRKIIDNCYEKAKDGLSKNVDKLKLLADTLVDKEVMDVQEVRKLLGFEQKADKEKEADDKDVGKKG
ncbi:ATP-dependent zinc metalloprotease FtsH [Candidatus Omnitrophota bacterium]